MIGRPGYAPQDLLKLYIYRVRSGRHLEAETRRNIEVIWLLRHLKPTSRPGRFSMGRTLSSQVGPLFGLADDQLTIRIAAKPSLAVLRDRYRRSSATHRGSPPVGLTGPTEV
jgi:hypothetical protein